jgi:hypothetical protein
MHTYRDTQILKFFHFLKEFSNVAVVHAKLFSRRHADVPFMLLIDGRNKNKTFEYLLENNLYLKPQDKIHTLYFTVPDV